MAKRAAIHKIGPFCGIAFLVVSTAKRGSVQRFPRRRRAAVYLGILLIPPRAISMANFGKTSFASDRAFEELQGARVPLP